MPAPSRDELREFVDDPLASKLEANQNIRAKQRRRTRIFTVVYLIVVLPVLCAVTSALGIGAEGGFWSTYWITFAVAGGAVALYAYLWKGYCEEQLPFDYRTEIAAPVVHYIDPRLEHRPDDELPSSELEATGLFTDLDLYRCTEWFEGTVGPVQLDIAEIRLAGPRAGPVTRTRTADFSGLVVRATTPASFEGHTVVWPTTSGPAAGPDGWHPGDRLADHEPVEVDAEHFGDCFEVHSTAPSTATDVLTDPIVEALETARQTVTDDKYGEPAPGKPPFVAVFDGNRLTVLRPGIEYFGRPDDHTGADTSHLHRIGRELSAFVDLVERTACLVSDDR